ncbi:MAG: glycoside hydrolase family 13 protein [Clostridia bacterium]|nr:glycoside hydrolase family 13 protein [Clostridia bacterium]
MEAYPTVIHDSRSARFRTPQGAVAAGTSVTINIFAPYVGGVTLRLWENGEQLVKMQRTNDGMFTATVLCSKPCLLCYYFILHTDNRDEFYLNAPDMLGGVGEHAEQCDSMRSYSITVFDKDFKTPDWCAGGVMYQIFPDRFNSAGKGDPTGKRMHKGWNEAPEYLPIAPKDYYAADDFFGGDLKGIEEKLDYLADMGVSIIYLNPIFKSYSNHRYDTGDYESIDPLLGTNDNFAHLCKCANERNIRIILDGVFSHTGSDSRYFNRENTYPEKGALNGTDSKYYPWYSFESYPNKYDCWWGVWSLPCVNETEPSYMDYILRDEDSIVKRWLRAGASGWRLDVADELPDEFLFELRKQIKGEDPEALIIGEVWEDASKKESYGHLRPYLQGAQLDSVMNYPLRKAVLDYLLNRDAEKFARSVLSLRENYPPQVFNRLMNFVSTHDTERACTLLGEAPHKDTVDKHFQSKFLLSQDAEAVAKARLQLAYAILFLLPGIPCVYYGDEDYAQGYADPFNRAPKSWSKQGMQQLLKQLARIHKRAEDFNDLAIIPCGSALCIKRGNIIGIINPTDCELEQMLDISLLKSGKLELTNGSCTLSVREQGMYLLLDTYSFCVIIAD